jgi:hypothetical protein
MIRVDIFKGWPFLDDISNIVIVIVCSIMSWRTIIETFSSYSMDVKSSQLDIPNWPFLIIVAFGFFMVAFSAFLLEYKRVKMRFLEGKSK